ncbi:MAG TPA: zf-HC2 domain-containing protein [Candidatus Acidoferrum sp.]|nr:zf-HC2 domain-containing protein [Candidatus Acidoferrum sp.]
MERHDHFEELLAAASVGEATGAELAELEAHLRECPACRHAYADFVELRSVGMAVEANNQSEVTGAEAMGYIDSARFREKFLQKAEEEGILGSRKQTAPTLPPPVIGQAMRPGRPRGYVPYALGVAATVLLVLGAAAVYRGKVRLPIAPSSANNTAKETPQGPPQSLSPDRNQQAFLARLKAENEKLASEIASLKVSLAKESAAAEEWKTTAANSESDRAALLSAAKEREGKIGDLQRQLEQAETQVTNVRGELEKVQASNQDALAADQVRINELSDQVAVQSSALAREREMLAANRDIRDLMAARNLHIADVFDTDTRGKTRTAFGRVFFTEGKSLIIYAYDLNDKRVQEAGYHYRVWGKKEGPGQGAKSLGIFYSDDKAQKRWVFKYEDPKVLSEIDSVFVTLEPPGKNPSEPKGEKFLYAYLRNQPNHP